MLRKIAIALCQRFFHQLVTQKTRSLKRSNTVRYFFFDIDNTLADAWPSFLVPWPSQNQRVASLAVFINMRKWVLLLQQFPNNQIFFITARSYATWRTTRNWLVENQLSASWSNTIITNTPDEKLKIIRQIAAHSSRVYWIDDLSYNHERGTVLYYDQVIEKIKNTSIRYFGVTTINQINQV